MTAALRDIMRASQDDDLMERIAAAAAEYGVPQPEQWAEQQMIRLVTRPVTPAGDTIASVYAYAYAVRQEALATIPPAPGENPGAVTDPFIRAAVADLYGPTAP